MITASRGLGFIRNQNLPHKKLKDGRTVGRRRTRVLVPTVTPRDTTLDTPAAEVAEPWYKTMAGAIAIGGVALGTAFVFLSLNKR